MIHELQIQFKGLPSPKSFNYNKLVLNTSKANGNRNERQTRSSGRTQVAISIVNRWCTKKPHKTMMSINSHKTFHQKKSANRAPATGVRRGDDSIF